jgi:SET domain-containing protein
MSRKTPVRKPAARKIREPIQSAEPIVRVRRSKIHGRGVYATRTIRKGTRIIEYVGERLSHDAADDRYADRGPDDGHTFLFIVDDDTVVDAGVGGNAARYINHKCDANCEPNIEGGRIFIDAIRTIRPGEELGYDYSLTWVSTDDPEELKLYDCRCGAPNCRGTMLDEESQDLKDALKKKKNKKKKAGKRKGG